MPMARSNSTHSGSRVRRCLGAGLVVVATLLSFAAQAQTAAPVPVGPAASRVTPATDRDLTDDKRSNADARSDFEVRPFASADVWLPRPQDTRTFPDTFSTVQDLHSRAYLQDLAIPTMGGDGRGVRDQSPTEHLIRQVRKEGMPVARLWQSDQALVSLGLNRKGKPGLWIIQKTR